MSLHCIKLFGSTFAARPFLEFNATVEKSPSGQKGHILCTLHAAENLAAFLCRLLLSCWCPCQVLLQLGSNQQCKSKSDYDFTLRHFLPYEPSSLWPFLGATLKCVANPPPPKKIRYLLYVFASFGKLLSRLWQVLGWHFSVYSPSPPMLLFTSSHDVFLWHHRMFSEMPQVALLSTNGPLLAPHCWWLPSTITIISFHFFFPLASLWRTI